MAFILGIDGGGSGCRAAVATADGRIVGIGTGGPSNIASDFEASLRHVLAATTAALSAAGEPCPIGHLTAALGLAGANAPGTADRLRAALPFARTRVESDAVTGAAGALGDADGIVAALGTGSVFAVQRGGVIRQIGGWGLILGDEGGGAWIGRALLARALLARDGLHPMTPLLRAVLADHGEASGIVAFSLSARPADFAALAPHVTGSDDPAADAIMVQATDYVTSCIGTLSRDGALPVVLLGGLAQVYATRLAGRWPLRAALGTGLDGALRLARAGVAR